MNRRGFLSSLIAVPAAAWLAPNVLATSAPTTIGYVATNVTFKDIPITSSESVPRNHIYFMSRNGPYVIGDGKITKLSM